MENPVGVVTGDDIGQHCRSPPLKIFKIGFNLKIFGGKNMNEYNYTGNKTKNCFTAYLQKCIRWKRCNFLLNIENINGMEMPLEKEILTVGSITVDEMLELHCKEKLLIKECGGEYPEWDELSDQRLVTALLRLREDERHLIYQHVFEERTFKEIGYLNGIRVEKVKSIYYYAIHKIRKWTGGDR